MRKSVTTSVALAAAAAAAITGVTTSAFAAPTATRPTALTLHAAHSSVAPRHKDTLTATLRSLGKPVANAPVVLESRAADTRKFGNPTDIGTTDDHGQVAVPVTPGNKKGHKEQYRVVFAGDATHRASHSSVITVTVAG